MIPWQHGVEIGKLFKEEETMKKILSLVLSLMLLASMAVIPAAAEDYREPITLTMFSQLANFAGEQTGWFAKELKDRFNVTLKIVSSNVDTNALTSAMSAGELGDIICMGEMSSDFLDCVKAELILDLSDIDLTAYPNINTYMKDSMAKISDMCK